MNKLLANYVDIFDKRVYYAEISFDSKVRNIKEISPEPNKEANFLAPGFIDSHVHIESSLCTPRRFAEMVAEHGTIAAICDPHEITNVLGEEGFDYMIEDAQKACMKLYFMTPSCVPATSFETSGATFGTEETRRALEKSIGLAEMMNYPGVIFNDPSVMAKIEIARDMQKPIDGHCPGLSGEDLKKYVSAGISTDHECSTLVEAREKIAAGMTIQIREGSAAKNFEALYPLIESDPRSVLLCTDDAHPDDICERGHIERFVRMGQKKGIDIFSIYKTALLNPIRHYSLHEVGTTEVGTNADFIIVDNLENFEIQQTYINGQIVFSKDTTNDIRITETPKNVFCQEYQFNPSDFAIKIESNSANVIECIDGELITRKAIETIDQPIGSDYSCTDDIVKIAVINRYKKSRISMGLIKGTGLKNGAIASSIAHDSHNVVIIGRDNKQMCEAAKEIFRMRGGLVATQGQETLTLPLPYAGLMTDEHFRKTTDKYESLLRFANEKCGIELSSPFMTMAFMPLLVIPEIKLSDMGLFDSTTFKFIKLFN